MAITTIDTLGAAKRLEEAGFERECAEAIVKEIHKSQGEVATKFDIMRFVAVLKSDIQRLEEKIDNLRWEMIMGAGVVAALIKFTP